MGITIVTGSQAGEGISEGLSAIANVKYQNAILKQTEQRYQLAKMQAEQQMGLEQLAGEREQLKMGMLQTREQREQLASQQEMSARGDLGNSFENAPPQDAALQEKVKYLGSVASKIVKLTGKPEDAIRFMDEGQKEIHEQVSMEAAEKAGASIQRGMENGAFSYETPAGPVDRSDMAQGLTELLKGAKTPQERLAVVKHLEETMNAIAERKSEAAVFTASMQDMTQRIEMSKQVGGRPDAMQGAIGVISRMQAGAYTDHSNGKTDYNRAYGDLDDEIHGRKELKQQLEMLKLENETLKAGKTRADTEKSKTQTEMAGPWGMRLKSELDTQRQTKVEETKASLKSDTPARPSSLGERSNAVARLNKVLKDEFPDGKPVDKYKAREAELRRDMGMEPLKGGPQKQGKDSAASVLDDIKAGKIDKAAAIERAKALGFKSYEELKKAAGK